MPIRHREKISKKVISLKRVGTMKPTATFVISYKGLKVDALAPGGDEGRGYLR